MHAAPAVPIPPPLPTPAVEPIILDEPIVVPDAPLPEAQVAASPPEAPPIDAEQAGSDGDALAFLTTEPQAASDARLRSAGIPHDRGQDVSTSGWLEGVLSFGKGVLYVVIAFLASVLVSAVFHLHCGIELFVVAVIVLLVWRYGGKRWLAVQQSTENYAARITGWGMKQWGVGVLILGLVGLLLSSCMDTSVETGYGDRVHNIGLIQEKQTYLILCAVVAVVGVLLVGFDVLAAKGEREPPPIDEASDTQSKAAFSFPSEPRAKVKVPPPGTKPRTVTLTRTQLILLILGVALGAPIVLWTGPLFLGGTVHNNARCSVCGYEFRISEMYRNNVSGKIVEERCPRCRENWCPYLLYSAYDEEHNERRQGIRETKIEERPRVETDRNIFEHPELIRRDVSPETQEDVPTGGRQIDR
jgi:hypothetical protein